MMTDEGTCMDHQWNGTDKGKSHYSEKNLFQCQAVHHSSNIGWPRPEVVLHDEKPVSDYCVTARFLIFKEEYVDIK